MKNTKKLLSLLLVAVMLLGLLAGCGGQSPDSPAKLGSAGAFTKWFGAQKKSLSNLPTAGTYYFKLTKDITLRQPAVVAGGHAVVIDMDGHTITAKEGVNTQIFTVGEGTSLTLKNGAITTTGADADGGLIAVTGAGSGLHLEDVALTNTDDSFVQEMFSGGVLFVNAPVDGEPAVVTLSGSTVITGAAAGVRRNGGAVTAKGNAEIHMYGGTIQDGQAGCSGNVYLADQAKFYMHDGVITGGAAVGKSETTGLGGNVDIRGQARFYLYGGTITAGMAKKRGGNIFVSSFGTTGTVDGFHIYGGTVTNGSAQNGGNIFATDKASCVSVYGGEITDGESMSGGNIYLESANLIMQGGTLNGRRNSTVNMYGGNVFCSHGTVTILDGTIQNAMVNGGGANVYMADAVMDIYGGLISGGDLSGIGVNTGGGNLFAEGESVVNFYNGTITRGTANYDDKEDSAAGANVMLARQAQMHMFGGEVSDGVIHGNISRGGCIYVYGQGTNNNTWFHMYGGELRNGETDGTMRGMLVGAYGESKNDQPNAGRGSARIFAGTLTFTGPEKSEDRYNSLYTNRKDLACLRVYDPVALNLEGLMRGAQTGPCEDPSHNVVVETQEATCITQGWNKHTCATCGDWYEVTAEATGHTETATEVAATATTAGMTEHKCSVCENVRYTDIVPATGK